MFPGLVSSISSIVVQLEWRNLPKMCRECFKVDQVLDFETGDDRSSGNNSDLDNNKPNLLTVRMRIGKLG